MRVFLFMIPNIVFTGNEQRQSEKLYEIIDNVRERQKTWSQNNFF